MGFVQAFTVSREQGIALAALAALEKAGKLLPSRFFNIQLTCLFLQ